MQLIYVSITFGHLSEDHYTMLKNNKTKTIKSWEKENSSHIGPALASN